jgi:hypothetical protein
MLKSLPCLTLIMPPGVSREKKSKTTGDSPVTFVEVTAPAPFFPRNTPLVA